jgi:hypothetical protein
MRKTMSQVHAEKREQALAEIRDKVAQGGLVIRQMTAEERVRYARTEVTGRRTRRGH